ncbi:hypothetical protein AAC691_17360 [Nguyenibacter vanlangensis]|uniref:Uncharacterized protein n=1 Tax=Nguyenibacter vanlangensis TaxID=1216886 RepID=A0ABZ3D2T1_9PROT
MIIGATRIKVASRNGPHALIRHVFHGTDNESIKIIQGGKYAVRAAHEDARAAGRTYSNRHFSVSPEESTTREQAHGVFASIAGEFGFNLADATIVEHHKPREGDQGYERHWHMIVPEIRRDGTTLDSRFMKPRQEKLGRLAEIRLGHPITQGKHDRAVLAAMEKENLPEAQAFAEAVRWREFGPGAGEPKAAYSANTHQILRRNGLKTPQVKAAITAAWQARSDENPLSFKGMLHACGIDLISGRRPGAWVAAVGGVEITAIHRLLRVKQVDVEAEMAKAQKRQAPAWTRQEGGYEALSPQGKERAEAAYVTFRQVYEKARGHEYPHGLHDYVQWCQKQEARKPYHERAARPETAKVPEAPAARPEPQAPKALPLPDDPAALRRIIGVPRWSERNRDPDAIAAAYQGQVNKAREKAEAQLERAEAAIERTAPSDKIADGKALGKLADIAAGLTIKLLNVVLRPLGIPITWEPSMGAARIIGQNPGNPSAHEAAHRDAEEIREKLVQMATPDAIRAKAAEVAAARQAEHDAWMDSTAPARMKLAEIEARLEAERIEAERRAKAEEARQAAALAAKERGAVEVDLPDFEPETDILRGLEI